MSTKPPKTKIVQNRPRKAAVAIASSAEAYRILNDIKEKVDKSAVLNGGFDTLLRKVDLIESAQEKISTTVEAIHTSIYEPDDGLFSRIASVKSSVATEKLELDKKLIGLDTWKNQSEKLTEEDKKEDAIISKKLDDQERLLEDISRWRKSVSSIVKWASVAFGGGGVTLGFKLLYDYVTLHWK